MIMFRFLSICIFLSLFVSCAEKREEQQTAQEVKQTKKVSTREVIYNSPYYKSIRIWPEFKVNKDTFNVGDTLKALIWLDEKADMLKNLAKKEGLNYRVNFKYDSLSSNKYYSDWSYAKQIIENEKADLKFIVANDTLEVGEFANQKWKFGVQFSFNPEQRFRGYDTLFVQHLDYVITKNIGN